MKLRFIYVVFGVDVIITKNILNSFQYYNTKLKKNTRGVTNEYLNKLINYKNSLKLQMTEKE